MSRKQKYLKGVKDSKKLLKESKKINQSFTSLGVTECIVDINKNKTLVSMAKYLRDISKRKYKK